MGLTVGSKLSSYFLVIGSLKKKTQASTNIAIKYKYRCVPVTWGKYEISYLIYG